MREREMAVDMIYVCVFAKSDTSRQITTFSLTKLRLLVVVVVVENISSPRLFRLQILCQHVVVFPLKYFLTLVLLIFKVSFEDGLGILNFEKCIIPTHTLLCRSVE